MFGEIARYKKIIVTLANILTSYNVLQLQVDNTLKIIFFSKKLKQITEYNKSYSYTHTKTQSVRRSL